MAETATPGVGEELGLPEKITKKDPLEVGRGGIQFGNWDQMWQFCNMLHKSGFAPKNMEPAQIMGAIQYGMELGVPPMQALNGIAMINGRPSVWGDLALALCQRHPEWEWMEEVFDATTQTATCKVKRRGTPVAVRTFSMEDAKRAKLAQKDTYQQYPQRMCAMRARSWALRDTFSDALKGLVIKEEAEDSPPAVGPDGVREARVIDVEGMIRENLKVAPPETATVETVDVELPPEEPPAPAPEPAKLPKPPRGPKAGKRSFEEESRAQELYDTWRGMQADIPPQEILRLKRALGIELINPTLPVEKLQALLAGGEDILAGH